MVSGFCLNFIQLILMRCYWTKWMNECTNAIWILFVVCVCIFRKYVHCPVHSTCWLLRLICLESALFTEMKCISLLMICAKVPVCLVIGICKLCFFFISWFSLAGLPPLLGAPYTHFRNVSTVCACSKCRLYCFQFFHLLFFCCCLFASLSLTTVHGAFMLVNGSHFRRCNFAMAFGYIFRLYAHIGWHDKGSKHMRKCFSKRQTVQGLWTGCGDENKNRCTYFSIEHHIVKSKT